MGQAPHQPEVDPLRGLPGDSGDGLLQALLPTGMLDVPRHPGIAAAAGRFDILGALGAGGMGVALLARDTGGGGLVALKFLKPALLSRPEAVARFLAEARHMAALRHPHILPVTEVCDRPEGPYYVMPYAAGGSLAARLSGGRALPPAETVDTVLAVAEALDYAHRQGIIHRDLKPSNILFDARGQALVADFGLMRTVFNDPDVMVGQSQRVGTPAYMSPAVAAGEAEDTRCDIYAFGATLYEMLAGAPPYEGAAPGEIVKRILAGPPPPLRQRHPKVDARLACVAETAMARRLRERYATMADVVEDLRRIRAGGEPLGARARASRLAAAVPTLRRAWPLAALLGVAAVLLLAWPRVSQRPALPAPVLPPGPLESVMRVQLPGVCPWHLARIGDWDGDGEADLYLARDNRLLVLAGNGEIIHERTLTDVPGVVVWLDLVADINGDGKDDPFVHWVEGEQMHVAALAQLPYELLHVQAPGRSCLYEGIRQVGQLEAEHLVSLRTDAPRLLLCRAVTGWPLHPRGLYAFDTATARLQWRYLCGPFVMDVITPDLDGDGAREIVFGTGSTNNGNTAEDGSDDAHCYAYALNGDGTLRWRTELGGAYVSCRPVSGAGHGAEGPRLLFWVYANPESGPSDLGQLVLLDTRGQVVTRYDLGAELQSCLAGDLDGDGQPEILATDRLGRLHRLRNDLSGAEVRQVVKPRHDWALLALGGVGDVNGDGRPEIVLTASDYQLVSGRNTGLPTGEANVRFLHDNAVIVLGADLQEVARHPVARLWKGKGGLRFTARVVDTDRRPPAEILVCADDLSVLRWRGATQFPRTP